jgi:hypothetical protein
VIAQRWFSPDAETETAGAEHGKDATGPSPQPLAAEEHA